MREIKFRGKRIDNGEWAFGYYAVHKMMLTGKMDYFIIVNEQRPQSVDPATVGEYTGLTDKNGKKIYEGDILDCDNHWVRIEIQWHNAGFRGKFFDHKNEVSYAMIASAPSKGIEVIGNVYENPELMEDDPA